MSAADGHAAPGGHALVVVAHPDDAELAVGGLLATLAGAGTPPTVALFTTSERDELAPARRAAAEAAAGILGHRTRWVRDGRLHQVEELPEHVVVAEVDSLVAELRPSLVVTHDPADGHVDHALLARAVLASSRRWSHALYTFRPVEPRTPALAAFEPNVLVDISGVVERKREALEQYRYPGQGFRALDLDAVAAVDRYHGALAGCAAAEGLRLVRRIGLPQP